MGVDFGDYDNDGWLDVVKSNFAFEYHNLYHNEQDGTFTDQAPERRRGPGSPPGPLVSWGTKFLDYDNDGWKDVVVINGHVYPHLIPSPVGRRALPPAPPPVPEPGRRALRRRLRGVGTGHSPRSSRAGAWPSAISTTTATSTWSSSTSTGRPSILRNDGGNAGSWISVKLRGTNSNRMGAGGPRSRPAPGPWSRSSMRPPPAASSPPATPGCTSAWGPPPGSTSRSAGPSGKVQKLKAVPANQIIEVDEDLGLVAPPG